jgi:putative aldouronate transport system permease protein
MKQPASPILIRRIRKTWQLYVFILPAMVFYIIFKYMPIYGLQMAFQDYSPFLGYWKSPWVGFRHFRTFFNSPRSLSIIGNTLRISVMSLFVGFPAPIVLALMLHHAGNRVLKKTVQLVTFAPHFISTVVLVSMISVLFSSNNGIVNVVLEYLGFQRVFFMGRTQYFVPLYVVSGVWQNAGWNAVVYLAALAGVNPELHESALIDGANKILRIWHVDIPSILPTIVTMFLLAVGSLFSGGFEKVYLMQNDLNINVSEVIATLVYKRGLVGVDYSFAAAIGLMESVINVVLLTIFNRIAKTVSGSGLW